MFYVITFNLYINAGTFAFKDIGTTKTTTFDESFSLPRDIMFWLLLRTNQQLCVCLWINKKHMLLRRIRISGGGGGFTHIASTIVIHDLFDSVSAQTKKVLLDKTIYRLFFLLITSLNRVKGLIDPILLIDLARFFIPANLDLFYFGGILTLRHFLLHPALFLYEPITKP